MPPARFTKAELIRYAEACKELGHTGAPAITLTKDGPRLEIVSSAISADDAGSQEKGIRHDRL